MRIYLRKNYREIVLGSVKRIRKVMVDSSNPNAKRYYIEGDENDQKLVQKMQFQEQDAPVIEEPIRKETKSTKESESESEDADTEEGPSEYYCKKHKMKHRNGSAAYTACWEDNFGDDAEDDED